MYQKKYAKSIECFREANNCKRHDSTFMQLGKVYTLQDKYKEAIEVYLEALEYVLCFCVCLCVVCLF